MDSDFRAAPLSRGDIFREAHKLRDALGLSHCMAMPIVKVIEYGLPQLIEGFNYEIVDDGDMPGREAETKPMESKIAISQTTYSKAYNDDPHARFTLGHEIGHLILHTPESISLAYEADVISNIKTYEKPGWQADAFAGEFLAPTSLIMGLGVAEIERLFLVSHSVAMRQFDFAARKIWFGHCGQSGQQWLPGLEMPSLPWSLLRGGDQPMK